MGFQANRKALAKLIILAQSFSPNSARDGRQTCRPARTELVLAGRQVCRPSCAKLGLKDWANGA
jgi:hypothetical protein